MKLAVLVALIVLAVPCAAEEGAPLATRAFVIASYTSALDRGGDRIVGDARPLRGVCILIRP